MNKLNISANGGEPIYLDDLRWMDASYRDALSGLLNGLGLNQPGSFIISGCVITRTPSSGPDYNYAVTAGYVCINGEVCKVIGQTFIGLSSMAEWAIGVTYDLTGSTAYNDASTHQVYEIHTGILQEATIGGDNPGWNMPTLQSVLFAQEGWNLVSSFGTYYSNFGGTTYPLAFRKDTQGYIHIRGIIKYNNGGSVPGGNLGTIFTLPAGYIPAKTLLKPITLYASETLAFSSALIQIDATNGNVSLIQQDYINNNPIEFPELIFSID